MTPMPKRKEPELGPKEQFKRFQETAKKQGVDAGEAEQKFAAISTTGLPGRPVPRSSQKSGT